MTAPNDAPDADTGTAADGTGPSGLAERITGSRDPRDPDGLVTLDDLPDRSGGSADLSDLTKKTIEYGDDSQ